MAPRSLAALSTVLAAAGNVAEALNALAQDVLEHDRNGHAVLFNYDAKRDLLAERLIPAHEGMRTAQIEIAIDHLPTAVRRVLATGKQFADLGTESAEYLDDVAHTTVYDVNTIANYDPAIIPLLDSAVGSAFERRGLFKKFVAVPFEPDDEGT